MSVKIGDKFIGEGHPTFIVAEIGINHNGDVEIAKELIDVACESGCDAVKFQKRKPDICVPEQQKSLIKETPWGVMTYLEYKKHIEFGKKEYDEIDVYCKEKKIMWFASAWDIPSVDFLEQFSPPCYKVPSACLLNDDLLLHIKSKGRPVILSTGMSSLAQIDHAIRALSEKTLVVLHCNSTYPIVLKNYYKVNLLVIQALKKKYGCPIGYSGHEVGVFPTVLSVAMGADCVERHITLDRAMWGTDHSASLESRGLKLLVRNIRVIPILRGDGVKRVYAEEVEMIKKLRGKLTESG